MTNKKNDLDIDNKPKDTAKPSKLVRLISKNKLVSFLCLALIALSAWTFIKISFLEKRYEKQTAELRTKYDREIDSLTTRQLELTSKVFSWAIRSELTRDNKEQVNQFFLNFIKEPGVTKVEFVDALTARITLSTDKKNEGNMYLDQVALLTDKTIHYSNNSALKVISPVFGLNNKLGVLVIDYEMKK
jgi:L-lactate utilization protein LutC